MITRASGGGGGGVCLCGKVCTWWGSLSPPLYIFQCKNISSKRKNKQNNKRRRRVLQSLNKADGRVCVCALCVCVCGTFCSP